jgi:hypothetical protein
MKLCAYCGRENQDEFTSCRECGTQFVDPAAGTESHDPHDFTWFKYALGYTSMFLAVACFYLLSLGPVTYYWGSTTRVVPPLRSPTGATMVSRTSYPRWVGVVYYPAFSLLSAGGFDRIYSSYLAWWDTQKAQKP